MYGTPKFTEYDLSLVRVDSAMPPAGPSTAETVVTLQGSHFANYGDGQLVVRAGGRLFNATLLDETRIQVIFPAETFTAGTIRIGVSLNGGKAGTFSADDVPYVVYVQPELYAISPTTGDANGGTNVIISGRGFAPDPSIPRSSEYRLVQIT